MVFYPNTRTSERFCWSSSCNVHNEKSIAVYETFTYVVMFVCSCEYILRLMLAAFHFILSFTMHKCHEGFVVRCRCLCCTNAYSHSCIFYGKFMFSLQLRENMKTFKSRHAYASFMRCVFFHFILQHLLTAHVAEVHHILWLQLVHLRTFFRLSLYAGTLHKCWRTRHSQHTPFSCSYLLTHARWFFQLSYSLSFLSWYQW